MSHQRQLEASKYRNWVRGGLAYKYLKEGIEGFTDEVVLREHNRILHVAKHTPGLTCNQCCLKNLRPLHKCHKDPVTGKNKCHWGQLKCNCLSIKDTRPCRDKVCDVIMEEILKSHASTPPAPNFRNTDMRKWCSAPWEIAKCFINAPGYADKTNAADIDAAGLLHVFINNKNLKSHLPCIINGSDDNFNKTLQRRNTIFHSPTMELEDKEMNECIDDIVAILKDDKELKDRYEAIQAIDKLKQLKERNFIITSHCEVEVCRATITSITKELEGLKQTIQDAQNDMKRIEATKAVEIEDSDSRFEILYERVEKVESEITTIEQRVTDVESMENKLHVIRDCHRKQLEFVKAKQELQHNLVKLYQQYYVKTSLSPLKLRENDINIQEIYVSPRMVMLPKSEKCNKNMATYRNKLIDIQQVKSCSENAASPKPVPIHSYHEIFQTDGHKHKKIYILGDVGSGKSSFCKMMIQNWCSAVSHNSGDFVLDNHSESYTNGTYENTDKSGASDNELTYLSTSISESDIDFQCNDDDSTEGNGNINEMGKFDLLFFIPLQRMSGINEIKEMIKAIATYAGFTSNDTFIERLFEQESECCLIVVDGLDEWTLPKSTNLLPHVSYGLPNTGGTKQATVLTLSRPSAKGVLNMKSSEYDQKVELLGINVKSVKCFIEKYISKFNKTDVSSSTFLKKIETAKLEHLERTPLLLQQVLWLYCCTGNEIGKSVSDTYSHLVNIMLAWSQNKDEEERSTEHLNCVTKQDNSSLQLPRLLHRFPRCKANKRFLLQLAEVAFETWARGTGSSTFGRSELLDKGLSKDDIDTIIKLGILVEENCFDPTKENTKFEFIHVSYLEYFVALHISSHYEEEQWSLDWEDISVVDALHESNTLKMICGLSPLYISELSSNISECVNRDESIIKYRNSLSYSEKKNLIRFSLSCSIVYLSVI